MFFNAYSLFYNNIDALCFYIQHQNFEAKMAQNALNLHELTYNINNQLKKFELNNTLLHKNLFTQLNSAVSYVELLNAEIKRSRDGTNKFFNDFQDQFFNIFNKINEIKFFFLNEINFIYTIFFFMAGNSVFFFVITSMEKTKNS